MYKKIRKQNGEAFAQTLRNHHNGLLEIEGLDEIVRYAGRDAVPLLPYLMTLLNTGNDNVPQAPSATPFALLEQAGYNAFYADTLEKQNSIAKYFAEGELLCTFNDRARHENYHIVHAVRKDVDQINRADFEGKEERQDEYGTSVISIQMLKNGGFISIKNRYNHTVKGCDHTFDSNPDNIIDGLSIALKKHFNVDFTAQKSPLPRDFAFIGNRIFKYHTEHNNIYYGDQIWVKDGEIHEVDKGAGDALFDYFLFDNKTKTLKIIDREIEDNFANDFNRCYSGNQNLRVSRGNLMLNDTILIGAKQSRIKTVYIPDLIIMTRGFLKYANALTQAEFPKLKTMGYGCFYNAHSLTQAIFPALETMGSSCFKESVAMTQAIFPALETMEGYCFRNLPALAQAIFPALERMGWECFHNVPVMTKAEFQSLRMMRSECFREAPNLTQAIFPALEKIACRCFYDVPSLVQAKFQSLNSMGDSCFFHDPALSEAEFPVLAKKGDACFVYSSRLLAQFKNKCKTMFSTFRRELSL